MLLFLTANFCKAQFYKSVLPSPEFSAALEKIVLDFRVNFTSIQGNSLAQQPEVETYQSTIKLPGASECIISNYHSVKDTSASWQAIMYQGEDYNEAVKTYQNVFRLVKKSNVKWIDKSVATFKGDLKQPKEEVRFTVSTLQLDLNDVRYKNFVAEVEIISIYSGWEVHLNLHSKKPDQEG